MPTTRFAVLSCAPLVCYHEQEIGCHIPDSAGVSSAYERCSHCEMKLMYWTEAEADQSHAEAVRVPTVLEAGAGRGAEMTQTQEI